jgi:hypothetical protein
MRRPAYPFLFFLLLVSVTLAAQEAGYLDLVPQTLRPWLIEPKTGTASGGGIGAGDGATARTLPQPLRLTITNVDGADHKLSENLIYEVRVENTSDRTVKIPWTASPRDIEPTKLRPYEYLMASVAPRLVSSSGQVAVLGAAVIYGSDATSTMIDLAPGHWVRIRAKSPLSMLGARNLAAFLSAGQTSVEVGATWSFYRVSVTTENGECRETFLPSGVEIQSGNTMPVRLDLSDQQ